MYQLVNNDQLACIVSSPFFSSLHFALMEKSKRQVTIIDELWDNEQMKSVGEDIRISLCVFFSSFSNCLESTIV
jgi:hypothetical protein